jgi:hypothetical protein
VKHEENIHEKINIWLFCLRKRSHCWNVGWPSHIREFRMIWIMSLSLHKLLIKCDHRKSWLENCRNKSHSLNRLYPLSQFCISSKFLHFSISPSRLVHLVHLLRLVHQQNFQSEFANMICQRNLAM